MKKLLPLLSIPIFAGCLSTATPPVADNWLLESAASEIQPVSAPAFGEARLAVVYVRAPYDGKSFAVLRPDGSVAFDPLNQFASVPSALIKGTALDVLRGTGLFAGVQPSITTADVKTTLELVVDEIALDCRNEGERKASVKLILVVIRNRQVVDAAKGRSVVDVADGNYSAAFGTAFTKALSSAASKLKK